MKENKERVDVSILVLLDMLLGQKGMYSLQKMRRSFNPCFTGYASRS